MTNHVSQRVSDSHTAAFRSEGADSESLPWEIRRRYRSALHCAHLQPMELDEVQLRVLCLRVDRRDLHRDWARPPAHIRAGTGLAPAGLWEIHPPNATSAPGLTSDSGSWSCRPSDTACRSSECL